MAPLTVEQPAQLQQDGGKDKKVKAKKVKEAVAGDAAMAAPAANKKAEKKRKRAEAAAAAAGAAGAAVGEGAQGAETPSPEEQQPQLSKKERKKLAKQQRKEDKARPAGHSDGAAAPEAAPADGAAVSNKEKKKEKKKNKAKGSEEQEAAAPSGGGKPSKKQKKLGGGAAAAAAANGAAAAGGAVGGRGSYTPHPEVVAMAESEVVAWREERGVAVEGCDLRPVTTFAHAGFSPEVMRCTQGFQSPSPIQGQCWPIVMAGRDLIGIAATGSGKTLAFGLPALQRIVQKAGSNATCPGVTVLVLAPTRELAMQTAAVMQEAGSACGAPAICLYGGVPKREQAATLRRGGVKVVVGTPGRLQDLLDDGTLQLGAVDYVVLDEADRMLDLGFEPAVRAILSTTSADRQTLMFSATWPTIVRKLAGDFLRSPVKVTIGSSKLSASHSVSQTVEVVEVAQKDARLLALLEKYHNRTNRVIVFVLYKKEAGRVESLVKRKGWNAAAVHGDLSQGQRTEAVESFKAGKCPLLLATDVAARGLDIPDVEVVINYSFPLTTEDYVHRIGRTGRAGKTGIAHTLFCGASDKPRAGELINVLREAGQPVPQELLKFGTTVKRKESKLYGAHFKDVDMGKKATKVTFDSDDDE